MSKPNKPAAAPAKAATTSTSNASGGATITVTAKRDGFRRAGVRWEGATVREVADFSEEQLAELRAEPNLVVVDGGALPVDPEV